MAVEFSTGPAEGEEDKPRPTESLTLDGREMLATMPKIAVWTSYFAGFASSASANEAARSAMLFLDAALDPIDRNWLELRWRNPDDRLDLEHLVAMTNHLVDVWTPFARAEFEALGLKWEATHNRAERRAQQRRPATPARARKATSKR
jgi:hypothetical protein